MPFEKRTEFCLWSLGLCWAKYWEFHVTVNPALRGGDHGEDDDTNRGKQQPHVPRKRGGPLMPSTVRSQEMRRRSVVIVIALIS